jgi:hypothetical protein
MQECQNVIAKSIWHTQLFHLKHLLKNIRKKLGKKWHFSHKKLNYGKN